MVKVILTRNTDVFLSLSGRAAVANKAKAALFMSLHENSATNKDATGYEDYRSGSASEVTKLAHQAFHNIVESELLVPYKIKNRGMKTASYQVLRSTNMAAILPEHLFISNSNDLKLQTNAEFTKKAAKVYAKALLAALNVVVTAEKKKSTKLQRFDLNNPIIVLDAGHGGHDPGAVNGKEHESKHVLKLVQLIKKEIEELTSDKNKPVQGTVKVLTNTLNIYDSPRWSNPSGKVKKGEVFTVIGKVIVEGKEQYKLKSGNYINASEKFVKFIAIK
ncbi:MAG: N-acetylmuramoyl-L-alanine amidase [Lysinibacillus sp.]